MITRNAVAAALTAAALLGPAAATADTYHGPGYTITTRPPAASQRVYVYEYAPPDTVVYYRVPRQPPPYDSRNLSPYEADRYFGHPGRAPGLVSPRDSNPTDHATGIYNPRP